MGNVYGQLGLEERVEIYRLHSAGRSQRAIAATLKRATSTISREIKRNSVPTKAWPGGYEPVRAQRLAERRRRWDGRHRLTRQPALCALVKDRLAMGWSPEQIAGRLTLEHARTVISHESIYRFVYHRSAQKDYWHRLLPRRKSRRGHFAMQGGSAVHLIKRRQPLSDRTSEALNRNVPGHWEADFMLFAQYGQAILVAHERSSRYTLVQHQPDRKAHRTVATLKHLLTKLALPLRKTIAFDNGPEFAFHHQLADQIGIQTFFCDVRAPWQKGGVENAIGRLRRPLPRKTNLDQLTPSHLRRIASAYNNTPRKCLDFKTPAEVFSNFQSTVALQT